MRLHIALLLSIILHAALIVGPGWLQIKPRLALTPSIEARLVPLAAPLAMADAISTEPGKTDEAISRHLAAPPRSLHGSALRRAEAVLSEHLFYPPEAVARGLEGEVILLLSLAENGRIVATVIARSSGHALLDEAALEAARRIGALPGNPGQTLLPVKFRLQ